MNEDVTGRRGDMSAMVRAMEPLDGMSTDPVQRNRRLVAALCRMLGDRGGGPVARVRLPLSGLSPRQKQTLTHLLSGDSEKEIAAKLEVSRHTVHVYVKGLYRHFGASSRAELLSRWVRTD